MKKLTHLDRKGKARMVDVSEKPPTKREATAVAEVSLGNETLKLIIEEAIPKGDVFAAARVAGIMAAKKTPEIIPLCHPLNITSLTVDLSPNVRKSSVEITATVSTVGQTGVEMEALTAVSVAALTVYDMCKAVDKGITITGIALLEKKGGRSGHYRRGKK